MKNNFIYAVGGIVLITILGMILMFLERSDMNSKKFISFNDGSIDCITIKVPAEPTKEQLAQVLIQDHDTLLGKTGDTVGCVNYEFS